MSEERKYGPGKTVVLANDEYCVVKKCFKGLLAPRDPVSVPVPVVDVPKPVVSVPVVDVSNSKPKRKVGRPKANTNYPNTNIPIESNTNTTEPTIAVLSHSENKTNITNNKSLGGVPVDPLLINVDDNEFCMKLKVLSLNENNDDVVMKEVDRNHNEGEAPVCIISPYKKLDNKFDEDIYPGAEGEVIAASMMFAEYNDSVVKREKDRQEVAMSFISEFTLHVWECVLNKKNGYYLNDVILVPSVDKLKKHVEDVGGVSAQLVKVHFTPKQKRFVDDATNKSYVARALRVVQRYFHRVLLDAEFPVVRFCQVKFDALPYHSAPKGLEILTAAQLCVFFSMYMSYYDCEGASDLCSALCILMRSKLFYDNVGNIPPLVARQQ